MRVFAALCSLFFAGVTAAQVPYPVGTCSVAWPNTSGAGSPTLNATVRYPAVASGVNTPVLPHAGGWPAIVFLHGYSLLGSDYDALGKGWSEAGFVVVLLNTAQWNFVELEGDAHATYGAILVANASAGLLGGAFDTNRIGIAGHSMGGAVAGLVLANNPGFRCGYAFAPLDPGPAAAMVSVPFGICAGDGDLLTPWTTYAQPYYQNVAPQEGLKYLFVLDLRCDHMNVVGLAPWANSLTFLQSLRVSRGFFRRFLANDAFGLEACLGPDALGDPALLFFERSVVDPQVWSSRTLAIGTAVRFSVFAESGLTATLGALSLAPGLSTPLGTLLLDPTSVFVLATGVVNSTGRSDATFQIPNLGTLIGTSLALQGIGASTSATLELGTATQLVVGP